MEWTPEYIFVLKIMNALDIHTETIFRSKCSTQYELQISYI